MESFEFPGVWWIPTDQHKTKFYGPLAFDPKNGGKLSLTFDESHEDHEALGSMDQLCIPLVHGRMDGRQVTLIKCQKTIPSWQNRDDSGDGFTQTSTVWTDTVLLGAHFNSLRDIEFNWMRVSYTHMERWLGYRSWTTNEKGEPELRPFQHRLVELESDLNVLIRSALYEEVGNRQVPYPRVPVAQIISDRKLPFHGRADDSEAFFPYIDHYLRDFMNLVTGEPNYPFNIATVSPYEGEQLVRIYYRIPGYDPNANRKVESAFTFEYGDFFSQFPSLLSNWLSESSKLTSACELFFKRYFLSNIDIETQFLYLVQAVEAYHRQQQGDTYLIPEDYSRIQDALSAEITKVVKTANIRSWAQGDVDPINVNSLRESLLNSVKYGNEFSLRRRLKFVREGILRDHLELTEKLLENPKVFINRVTETRNYLAHRLAERNSYVLNESEYPEYVRKLRKLLRLCFLVEMGLQPEDIEMLSQFSPISAP